VETRYSSSFTTSALDEGEWSASRPGRAVPPEKDIRYPLYMRLGGPQSRSGYFILMVLGANLVCESAVLIVFLVFLSFTVIFKPTTSSYQILIICGNVVTFNVL
jgi:hypothetical protein